MLQITTGIAYKPQVISHECILVFRKCKLLSLGAVKLRLIACEYRV